MLLTRDNIFYTKHEDTVYMWILTGTTHSFHTKIPAESMKLIRNVHKSISIFELNEPTLELEQDNGYYRVFFFCSGCKFHTEKLNIKTALDLISKLSR